MKIKILAGMVVLMFVMTAVVPVACGEDSKINYKIFKEGDIVYHEDEGKLGKPGHVGIIVRDDHGKLVVRESHPTRHGGIGNVPIDKFYSAYSNKNVKHLRVNVDDETAKKAAEYAKTIEGKFLLDIEHVQFFLSRPNYDDDQWYCSEFVYHSYKKGAGVDLSPSFKPWPWIAPKDIDRSKKTFIIRDDGSEVHNEAKDSLSGVDFTSLQLNYLSTYSDSTNQMSKFNFVLKAKKAEKGDEIIDIENATDLSLNSFFIGLTLQKSKFWVNLNPYEEERIIDEDLEKTDMGKIMLEADLQMKKDFCKYENPCESNIGETFWELLDEKSEELVKECMRKHPGEIKDPNNILFRPATRYWIVPDKTDTYGADDEVYIVDLTLNIKSEPVYEHSTYEIVNQNPFVSDECKEELCEATKEYGRYAMELGKEMILPLVVQEVNQGRNYSDLRQVYTSLALAQWYKDKYWHTSGIFTDLMDSKELAGLESKTEWNAKDIWRDYVKSVEEGEYHCWKNETKEETYREGDYIITETITSAKLYSSGGVDFKNIKLTNIGAMPSNLKELTSEAIYTPFTNEGDDFYFGGGLYMFYQTSAQPTIKSTPKYPKTEEIPKSKGFEAIFSIFGLLSVVYLINLKKKGRLK